MSGYNLLIKNILHPFGKISISLGSSLNAIRLIKYFNKRTVRRFFLKNKKFNVALISLVEFDTPEEYMRTVNGKNSAFYFSRRCEKMGYKFRHFSPNDEIDAIFEINTSSAQRQGKEMDESYRTKVERWPEDDVNRWFGVYSNEGILVAYIWTYVVGEMVLINRILGHKEHLKNNVMYLLITKVICVFIGQRNEHKDRINYIMYDTFGRRDNGLVLFKKRIGFKPYTVNFKA